ncbi:microtubule-associated protein futsch [Drosophila bipectinata]|uniref:microtubule-associated protein futsch n=1 Tax=Drosophila bipectinata TaxID=42026 RepID=UPI001C8A073E|nr:E3 ubiquitin-protein ligase RBBP6 [Drosophila bipectinata]
MLGDDDLDIYEDLEDFQKAEDKKSEQLRAWEEKYKSAIAEIESLKAENKALGKKIKVMEVNLQNLLDTAKAEVKRKETLIDQLRKEKDDVCFRRKRPPIDGKPADTEHQNKRPKLAQPNEVSRKEPEAQKNPFRARSKEDNKTEKPKSRSNSPRHSLQKTNDNRPRSQARHPENRQKCRDRRRSRSPRPESRRYRGKDGRESRRRSRSQSPGKKIQRQKSQTITTLFGDETICSVHESPHSEMAKKLQANKDPLTPMEHYTPESAKPQPTKPAIPNECEDTAAVDGYFEKNNKVKTKPPEKDIVRQCEGFFSSVSNLNNLPIPGLNLFPDKNPIDPIDKAIEFQKDVQEPVKKVEEVCVVSASEQKEVQEDEAKTIQVPGINSADFDHNEKKAEPIEECKVNSSNNSDFGEQKEIISETVCESIMQDTKVSDMLPVEELTVNETIDETVPMDIEYDIYGDLDRSDAPSFSKNIGSTIIESAIVKDGCGSPKKASENDEGIQIIEDIRLPEIADIENIAFTVDKNLQDSENPNIDTCDKPNDESKEQERKESSSSKDEAPSKSSILYAQPDSTKVDHNDDEILENAMNELTGEQGPPGNHNSNFLNLSLAEDAIEMALEQLHQSSPDETVVTSTSNKARQTSKDLITILAQSPLQTSPLKANSPLKSPETEAPEKTPLKKRRVNMSENGDKSLTQEAPVEETSESLSCTDSDASNVTKRFSMGRTDYQFEQNKGEIVLRVKRRSRRQHRAPIEQKTIPSDGKSV